MSNYGLVPYDELYHYGVKGMKWGIRRSPKKLSQNIDKLNGKNLKLDEKREKLYNKEFNTRITADKYAIKGAKLSLKNTKSRAKANKYANKSAKAEYKANKALTSHFGSTDKYNKYTAKAKRYASLSKVYETKAKVNRHTLKSDKYTAKANTLANKQKVILNKMYKNKKTMTIFSSTLNDLNNGTIKQGHGILMRYSTTGVDELMRAHMAS